MAALPPPMPPGPPTPGAAGAMGSGAAAGGPTPLPAGAPMLGSTPAGPDAAGGAQQLAQQVLQGVMALGKQIEQTLINFSQAMPEGAQHFQQANELIKQGIAAAISAAQGAAGGEAPAASPTEAGPQFPGGGFSSAGRP